MKKIQSIVSLVILSLAYQHVQAAPPRPNKCPSVAAVKARGLDVAQFKYQIWSVGVISEQYDTNALFTFAISGIRAQNGDAAIALARKALKTLIFKGGPLLDSVKEHWVCKYTTRIGRGYPAEAWTPPNGGNKF